MVYGQSYSGGNVSSLTLQAVQNYSSNWWIIQPLSIAGNSHHLADQLCQLQFIWIFKVYILFGDPSASLNAILSLLLVRKAEVCLQSLDQDSLPVWRSRWVSCGELIEGWSSTPRSIPENTAYMNTSLSVGSIFPVHLAIQHRQHEADLCNSITIRTKSQDHSCWEGNSLWASDRSAMG